MKIGVDAYVESRRFGGYISYVTQLVSALAALDKDDLLLFVPAGYDLQVRPSPRLTTVPVPVSWDPWDPPIECSLYWDQILLPRYLDRVHADIFFGPMFMAPMQWDGATVVTTHDLIFERSPEYYPIDSRRYLSTWGKLSATRSAAVITFSQSTKGDISNYWGIPAPLIHPIPLASGLHSVATDRALSRQAVARELGLREPFILNVGGAHRRKNLEQLLKAYTLMDHTLQERYTLVLNNSDAPYVGEVISRLPMAGKVIVTGYTTPETMPDLYAAAEVLVYPSLAEGFGLPPLEAMVSGTPVIASRRGPISEVVGDGALLVDPTNAAEIARALESVLRHDDLRRQLTVRGQLRSAAFSWERTARETRAVLAQAYEAHSRRSTPTPTGVNIGIR